MSNQVPENSGQPVLVYDGDCGICRYWVRYWQKLTGDSVDYQPYQEVAHDWPQISEQQFRQSIQYIESDDRIYSGACGVFTLLKSQFPYNLLLWLYLHIPGISGIAEFFYNFFSRHRSLLKHISYLCWGKHRVPARYDLVSWIFLRCIGLLYFSAFTSFAVQVTGLIGQDGILPVTGLLHALQQQFGHSAWLLAPNVFWFNSSDLCLLGVCVLGAVSGLLVTFNRFTRPALVVAYLFYLSLFYAGQIFMQYQWDLLLLECGFLAIFLARSTAITAWLYRWLVFRFMWLSGIVKIASGDSSWHNLTALNYHFETQPLPTLLAWYANSLPEDVLKFMTGFALFTELFIPFLIFLPRKIRQAGALFFITLQSGILLTGNYNFFNLLALAMFIFLFDDQAIKNRFPGWSLKLKPVAPSTLNKYLLRVTAVIILVFSTSQLIVFFSRTHLDILKPVYAINNSLHFTSTYGPFAVMTRVRNEIIIEGSDDGSDWKEYEFSYKPDALDKMPGWIIPHQPRLDWQMWFAALDNRNQRFWFNSLMVRLLQGSHAVTRLFKTNPFPTHPPTYIRARFYRYHFNYSKTGADKSDWWTREYEGVYFPMARLKEPDFQ